MPMSPSGGGGSSSGGGEDTAASDQPTIDLSALAATATTKCLQVDTCTWARDSHELFDYEARHVQRRRYLIRRPARVMRTASDVEVQLESRTPVSPGSRSLDHLLTVKPARVGTADHFLIQPGERPPSSPPTTASTHLATKKLWLIVKELKEGHHRLAEGDLIKLGRYKLRIKQLGLVEGTLPDLKWDDSEIPERHISLEDAATKQCRICYLDGGTIVDPLVCPCHCRGSIEFVHVECLRRWVRGKLGVPEESNSPRVATYFRQIFCELCKAPFPSTVTVNGERLPVVPLPPTEPPFVILEHISAPLQPSTRGIHLLCLTGRREVKLGRGHESDVRIPDVSISRYHATIRFNPSANRFVLEDHGSKFGTLVSLRHPTGVGEDTPLAVQVGRTTLAFSVIDPPHSFGSILELRAPTTPVTEEEEQLAAAAAASNSVSEPLVPSAVSLQLFANPSDDSQPSAAQQPVSAGASLQQQPPSAVVRNAWLDRSATATAPAALPAGATAARPGVATQMVSALQGVGSHLTNAFGLGGPRVDSPTNAGGQPPPNPSRGPPPT